MLAPTLEQIESICFSQDNLPSMVTSTHVYLLVVGTGTLLIKILKMLYFVPKIIGRTIDHIFPFAGKDLKLFYVYLANKVTNITKD